MAALRSMCTRLYCNTRLRPILCRNFLTSHGQKIDQHRQYFQHSFDSQLFHQPTKSCNVTFYINQALHLTHRNFSNFPSGVYHAFNLSLGIRQFPKTCLHTSKQFFASSTLLKSESVTIHYINRDGTKETVQADVGDTLLDVVLDNDLDIEGYGACEGTLACSTCHLLLEKPIFDSLPEPTDEELDMLDLAYGLTELSRLGCQIEVTKKMDGATFTVPEGVADARDV